MGRPGHCLRPPEREELELEAPSFPLKSSPAALPRKRSGTNSPGSSHTAGSRMIAHTLMKTVQPLGTA
ncbi:hypothetical protein PAHAL_9G456500 [Panicum hallii]|uniref:Uncharacterized protein n=1 Tax=Panicum hallii TaxID=206008 RepID=A0A2T8I4S5_9POAL|nr:hypothetical protein PAHAL_9G456500 [Panicum hallii]